MVEEPETIEDIAAGILNGVMICLLSAAFPVLLVWQAAAQWGTWTADLRTMPVVDTLTGIVLLLVSFQFLAVGFRLIRKNVSALRRRRRSFPID